jgi:DNA-binding transcriptional ArsR family regulator
MSKYADLDGQILSLLADGPMNWNIINHRVNSDSLVLGNWRVVDRRIQSLRRAGLIVCERRRGESVWRLA